MPSWTHVKFLFQVFEVLRPLQLYHCLAQFPDGKAGCKDNGLQFLLLAENRELVRKI
jgi:hypothetical protein